MDFPGVGPGGPLADVGGHGTGVVDGSQGAGVGTTCLTGASEAGRAGSRGTTGADEMIEKACQITRNRQ